MRTLRLTAFLVWALGPSTLFLGAAAPDPAVLRAHVTQKAPAEVVAELQALGSDLGGYNPVVDLTDKKLRPTLQAVLGWKPALASQRNTAVSPPSPFPLTLAAAADDLDLAQLLVKAGARAENPEPAAPVLIPRNTLAAAKSEAMRAWLQKAGAQTTLKASGKILSLENRVRIRRKPVDGPIVGYLSKGEGVLLLEVTALETVIDGRSAPWCRVQTAQKVTGWVWAGLLGPVGAPAGGAPGDKAAPAH